MGLASFFASWRVPKPKSETPQSPPIRRSNHHRLASKAGHVRNGSAEAPRDPITALPAPASSVATSRVPASKEEWRKSRGATLSQSKPSQQTSRRRSIFGGRPDDEENVPAMPGRAYTRADRSRDEIEMMPPGTAASNDSESSAVTSKSKRFSFGHSLSRRKSWFSSNRPTITAADMPPMPPMPVSMPDANRSTTATLPSDKRRSRAASIKSTTSTVRGPRKRRSFWASSNPDDSEDEVPPVPSLIRDQNGTPDSMTSDPFDSAYSRHNAGLPQTTPRTSDASSPRPISVRSVKTVRSYKPKSAAKGFMMSTSGATEKARLSYRKSFNIEDGAAMVCLTEEQRIEWAKLMNEGDAFQDQGSLRTTKSHTSEVAGKDKFSNDQALAALEFGVRS